MLHKYLLDEPPLVVLPSLAKRIGLNEAIVIQQVHYWITNAREARRTYNFRQGRWWVYHSYTEWKLTFPFWSEPTIKRTFLGLEKTGIVVSACLGDDPRDRSKWYSINYDALARLLRQGEAEADCPSDQLDPMDNITMIPSTGSKRTDASAEDESVQGIHSIRCLTGADTTADTTTDTTADRHLAKVARPNPHSAAAVAAIDFQDVSLPMQTSCPDAELVQALIANDVNRADAERLAFSVPEECRRQLEFLPYVTEFRSGRGAFLRSAIEAGYGAPAGYRAAQQQSQKTQKRALIQQSRTETARQRQSHLELARSRAQADPSLWEALIKEASQRVPKILRDRPHNPSYEPALRACINALITEREAQNTA